MRLSHIKCSFCKQGTFGYGVVVLFLHLVNFVASANSSRACYQCYTTWQHFSSNCFIFSSISLKRSDRSLSAVAHPGLQYIVFNPFNGFPQALIPTVIFVRFYNAFSHNFFRMLWVFSMRVILFTAAISNNNIEPMLCKWNTFKKIIWKP